MSPLAWHYVGFVRQPPLIYSINSTTTPTRDPNAYHFHLVCVSSRMITGAGYYMSARQGHVPCDLVFVDCYWSLPSLTRNVGSALMSPAFSGPEDTSLLLCFYQLMHITVMFVVPVSIHAGKKHFFQGPWCKIFQSFCTLNTYNDCGGGEKKKKKNVITTPPIVWVLV